MPSRAAAEISGSHADTTDTTGTADAYVVRRGEPTLARILGGTNDAVRSVTGLCHLLLHYGLGPTDLPRYPDGTTVLKALTDEDSAVHVLGMSPFIRTRNGLRYVLAKDPRVRQTGENHRDLCLATFSKLPLPPSFPVRLRSWQGTVADLINESTANFTFDQRELSWTATAFAHYLPPRSTWTNRFGERFSFSDLTRSLLARDLDAESCAGLHILDALISIERADSARPVLDDGARRALRARLDGLLGDVGSHQQPDGAWGRGWCRAVNAASPIADLGKLQTELLVTGHLLESIANLGPRVTRPAFRHQDAADWLARATASQDIVPGERWLCPFTHAANAYRKLAHSSNAPNPRH